MIMLVVAAPKELQDLSRPWSGTAAFRNKDSKDLTELTRFVQREEERCERDTDRIGRHCRFEKRWTTVHPEKTDQEWILHYGPETFDLMAWCFICRIYDRLTSRRFDTMWHHRDRMGSRIWSPMRSQNLISDVLTNVISSKHQMKVRRIVFFSQLCYASNPDCGQQY